MEPEASQVPLTHGLPSEPDPYKGRANLNPPSHMRLLKIHDNPCVISAGIYRRNWSSRLCVQNASCTVHTGDLTYLGGGAQMLRPQARHRSGICLCVCVHPHTRGENGGVVRPRAPRVPKHRWRTPPPGLLNA